MAKDPGFIFYPGDYLRDTQCLSEAAQTAYDRIMCEHMRNICIRQDQLNFFTKRLTPDQRQELLLVLTQVEGGYQIEWVAESIQKRKEYSKSRRDNREGKKKYKEHMNNISKTYVPHMEIENEIENINGIGIKEGVQGKPLSLSDESLDLIFDKGYLDPIPLAFKGVNIPVELERFKIKIRGAPEEYGNRNTAGLRNAFLTHLKNARTENNQSNGKKKFKSLDDLK